MPQNVEDLNLLEVEALQSQFKYFGQCPIQVFSPRDQAGLGHPQRQVRVIKTIAEETKNHEVFSQSD